MKTHYFGIQALLVVLCTFWLPFARGEDYIVDKETDGVLLNCAIAFFVVCLLFFIVVMVLAVYMVYKGKSGSKYLHKGYKVSEREDKPVKGVSSSNPFYGHGIYSPRSEGSIYLPGREPSHVSDKPTKIEINANKVVDSKEDRKRDSPPTEKGQQDAMISEKKVNTTYDNPAFENPGYESWADRDYDELA